VRSGQLIANAVPEQCRGPKPTNVALDLKCPKAVTCGAGWTASTTECECCPDLTNYTDSYCTTATANELSNLLCSSIGANRGAKQVRKFSGSCDACAVRISVVGEIGAALAFGGRSSPASTASHSLGALEVNSKIGGLGAFALLRESVGNELAIFAVLVV